MKIKLRAIKVNGGTQPREALNEDAVTDYAEKMARGEKFPPVVVFFDGSDRWLADGFHRVEAAKRNGYEDIAADVRQGDRRDAVLFSVGANREHGLPRTNADKRRAVLVLLNDAEWSEWSDREIARVVGVGNKFVGDMRSVCVPNTDEDSADPTPRKFKRSGKTHTQKPRKAKAAEPREDAHEEVPPDAPHGAVPSHFFDLARDLMREVNTLQSSWIAASPDDRAAIDSLGVAARALACIAERGA